MIRLFIAINIPELIKLQIQGMGRSIRNGRPVPADQLHLTLKFIGEVESSMLLDIHEKLEEITFDKFSTKVKGIGIFPLRGAPRVLWAGISPTEMTIRLRNTIENELASINIPKEKQKYSPHITLARLKNSPTQHVHNFLAGNAFLETEEFMVDGFNLYSSQLTKNGAIHTIESTYSLTE